MAIKNNIAKKRKVFKFSGQRKRGVRKTRFSLPGGASLQQIAAARRVAKKLKDVIDEVKR